MHGRNSLEGIDRVGIQQRLLRYVLPIFKAMILLNGWILTYQPRLIARQAVFPARDISRMGQYRQSTTRWIDR